MATDTLAAMNDDQRRISRALSQLLADSIAENGPMPFAEYMHRCLYEPGLGYYVNGLSKLGADGDFVTAPELSPDFAQCIAAQCAEVFTVIGGGSMIEFGGGSGRMAVDVLLALDRLEALPDHYYLLDVSADLKHTQQQTVNANLPPALASRVQWVNSFVDGFCGVVVANELFDAFPVQRFGVTDTGVTMQCINFNEQRGIFVCDVSDQATSRQVEIIERSTGAGLTVGYRAEYCPVVEPWWQSLAQSIDTAAVLVCDYGGDRSSYYSPLRSSGSVRCFFRHQLHDNPLIYQGVQDITADVDFTALAEAAVNTGFSLEGYTTMTQFMVSLGALERHQQAVDRLDQQRSMIATGKFKQVLLPEEMGERFMVAGFSKNISPVLSGFAKGDQSRLL